MLNLHTKYEIIELKKEDVQVLNSSAIASGYAGRDPQGGFAMEAFTVLLKSLRRKSEDSSLFLI